MSQLDLPTNPATPLEKTLPSDYYRSAEMYARERERIFCREWLCVGRETDVPNPGDSTVLDVLGESILLVRNESGTLRGFYNVCRHRGAQLCGTSLPGRPTRGRRGGRQANSLPVSLLDLQSRWRSGRGALYRGRRACEVLALPGRGRELGRLRLRSPDAYRCETAGRPVGCDSDADPPLSTGAASSRSHIRYDVAANWKIIVENYNECYHCGGVHPELCDIVPAFRRNGGSDLHWERGVPHREGAYTFTNSGTTARAALPRPQRGRAAAPFWRGRLPESVLQPLLRSRRGVHSSPEGAGADAHRMSVPVCARGDRQYGLRSVGCGRALGHHQSAGLGDLRERATWDRRAPARSWLLRADGRFEPGYSPLRRRAARPRLIRPGFGDLDDVRAVLRGHALKYTLRTERPSGDCM